MACEDTPVKEEVRPVAPRPFVPGLFAWFLFALLIFGLYLSYRLLAPFINTMILAVVFAAIFYPLYTKLRRLLRGRSNVAAVIILTCISLLVILPLVILVTGLIPQARQTIGALTVWVSGAHVDDAFGAYFTPFFEWLNEYAPFLEITPEGVKTSLVNLSRTLGQKVLGISTAMVGQAITFSLHFLLFLLAIFYFLTDGERLVARIKYLSPLRDEQEERLIQTLRKVSRAVLVGGLLVAMIQGFVGGLGLAFVGIPALFWGTIMVFAALVPVLGTGLVWVPALIFLAVSGEWKSAIFLAVWCGVLVTSIDSILRPFLMRDAAGIPVLFLFLSILGGLQAFGPFGLLYGPLILTFAMAMLEIYGEEYKSQLDHDV